MTETGLRVATKRAVGNHITIHQREVLASCPVCKWLGTVTFTEIKRGVWRADEDSRIRYQGSVLMHWPCHAALLIRGR